MTALQQPLPAAGASPSQINVSLDGLEIHSQAGSKRLTGTLFRVACDDTTITPGTNRFDIKQSVYEQEPAANGVQVSLGWNFDPSLQACAIRTTIHNPRAVRIDSVQLLDIELTGTARSFPSLGQPVYTDDLFFGMEYPASDCRTENNRLHIQRFYGTTATLIKCEPVVIAFRRPGMSIEDSFMEYILARKQHKTRPFAIYNTWYDLRDFNEQQVLDTWNSWHDELIARRGITLDSFVLDDGWDNYDSLWDKAKDRFPAGFKNITKAIEAGGSRLGIWVSPWGGYEKAAVRRRAFGKAHGYEILSTNKGFCLAAPRYKARFIELCQQFMNQDGVNYFKFDGFPSRCSDASHGHPIGDKFEQSAFVDAFIESLKQLKANDPDVFLNLTSGVWLSPWWLLHGDAVWRGEHDYGTEGTGAPVELSDNYVDSVVYRALREKNLQFPVSYLMTHGIIKGKIDVIHHTSETLQQWKDRVATSVGRGLLMQELYFTPKTLTSEQADFVAEMLKWWRPRANVLERTHMVFGDPQKSEAYGYVHWKDNQIILLLRNPSDTTQTLDLTQQTLRLSDTVKLSQEWTVVYSTISRANLTSSISLSPREVLLMESSN